MSQRSRTSQRSVMICLAALLPGAYVLGQPSAAPPANIEALGKAAIVAYAAHIKAFPFYDCRYRTTTGLANSVGDALRGKLINARSFDNRLIVDGEKVRYEGFAPPPDMKQSRPDPGGTSFIVPAFGSSDRYLADGKREMNYDPVMRTVNLFAMERHVRGISSTSPLGRCGGGPQRDFTPDILSEQKDKYDFEPVGPEEVEGRPAITVRFRDRNVVRLGETPIAFAHSFSFDTGRGYLPTRIVTSWNGRPKTLMFVTGIRECSASRWFPERVVIVDTPDKPEGPCEVTEVKLLELDVDKKPRGEEFAVDLPAGTLVHEFTPGGPSFRLKQNEKLRLEDLPTLFKMLERKKQNPLMDTAIPRTSPYRWLRWAGGVVGLLLLVGGVAFFVRRRWRAGRSPVER